MQLRRFIEDDTPTALGAVRLAFGDEAIILANRRVGDQVEIIATGQLDDSDLDAAVAQVRTETVGESIQGVVTSSSSDTPSAGNKALPVSAQAPESEPSRPFFEQLQKASSVMPIAVEQAISGNEARNRKPNGRSAAESSRKAAVEETSARKAVAARKPAQAQAPEQSRGEETSTLFQAQLDVMHQKLEQRFQCLEVNLWGGRHPQRSVLLQQLLGLGLGAELAVKLAERTPLDSPPEESMRHVLTILKDTLPIAGSHRQSGPGVTLLNGPSGGGKTTVLMKLARDHVSRSGNQSIVLVCADAERTGAFESLQAFGRWLGVPVVQADGDVELASLLDAFKHMDLVLVDQARCSASRHYRALPEELVEQQKAARRIVRQLLVLPAGLQSGTVDSILDATESLEQWQCVLTRLDETARIGELFSPLIRRHVPIASWSDKASCEIPLQKADASVLVATAVAMAKRVSRTPDDDWMMSLINPIGETARHVPKVSMSASLAET